MLRAVFVFFVLPLSGCGAFNEVEAFGNCVDLIERTFPDAQGLSDQNFDDDAIHGLLDGSSNGSFVFRVSDADGSTFFSCVGNSESREIYELEFRGETKSPETNASWSY